MGPDDLLTAMEIMSDFIINPMAYICFYDYTVSASSFLVRVSMTVDSNTSSGRGERSGTD